MESVKAQVRNGRLLLDKPTDLPNGTEVYLVATEGDVVVLSDDGLEDGEREELLSAIDESLAQADAGQVEDFSKVIAELRASS